MRRPAPRAGASPRGSTRSSRTRSDLARAQRHDASRPGGRPAAPQTPSAENGCLLPTRSIAAGAAAATAAAASRRASCSDRQQAVRADRAPPPPRRPARANSSAEAARSDISSTAVRSGERRAGAPRRRTGSEGCAGSAVVPSSAAYVVDDKHPRRAYRSGLPPAAERLPGRHDDGRRPPPSPPSALEPAGQLPRQRQLASCRSARRPAPSTASAGRVRVLPPRLPIRRITLPHRKQARGRIWRPRTPQPRGAQPGGAASCRSPSWPNERRRLPPSATAAGAGTPRKG